MKPRLWAAGFLLVAITLAVVGLPVYLIRPFSPQTSSGVSWSYVLRQASPWVSAAAALLLVLGLALLWRRSRWIGRTAWFAMTLVGVGAAWFARQNHFEWMFRPIPDARFVAAREATDVTADELVIGVARHQDALAFPVRRIGYHHLVNTTIGTEPIVATY